LAGLEELQRGYHDSRVRQQALDKLAKLDEGVVAFLVETPED
jgi:hypothetical protein